MLSLYVKHAGKEIMMMFKKLFGMAPTKKQETILAPVTGRLVPIEEVPDPTFAEKMLGDGVAIVPSEGVVVAPMDSEVISIFSTKHAIGLKTKQGLEILIHIGLDTVNMHGEGFEAFVEVGDKVAAGTKLISFSIELIQQKATNIITPVVITNPDVVKELKRENISEVKRGETEIIKVELD
jgi:PTS system glucose-specific IIA component